MNQQEKIFNNLSSDLSNKNCYSIDDNYFENFPKNVLLKIYSKNIVYQVPQNYFDSLSTKILLKIKKSTNTYQVPQNYFENFSNTVFQKINNKESNESEELEQIAPLLNQINKQIVFSLPEDYFEHKKLNKPSTKVIRLNRKKWYSIASAAAAIIAISILLIGKNFEPKNKEIAQLHQQAIKTNVNNNLQKVDDVVLLSHIETSKEFTADQEDFEIPFTQNVETQIQNLQDEEIEFYINNNQTENNNLILKI